MSSYSDLILAHGSLRVYYRLDDLAFAVLNDVGPNNLDGSYTATGCTFGVSGAIANDANTAVTFNGTSAAGTVADNNLLDLGDGPLSVECWVKRSATQGATQIVVAKILTGGYQLNFDSANVVNLSKYGGSGAAKSSVAITDTTTWHHIVATKNGSARKIYVDGVDVTSLLTDQTLTDTTGSLKIGSGNGALWFPGSVDEVAVYAAVLTAVEVRQHYDTGKGGRVEADSVSATDSRVSESEIARADSVTATEALVVGPEVARADSVSVSDSQASEPGIGRADSVTATDSDVKDVEVGLTEVQPIADALASEEANELVLGDSVTVTDLDTEESGVELTHSLLDSVTVDDVVTPGLVLTQLPVPGGGWRPIYLQPQHHELTLSDSIGLSDEIYTEYTEGIPTTQQKRELVLALV